MGTSKVRGDVNSGERAPSSHEQDRASWDPGQRTPRKSEKSHSSAHVPWLTEKLGILCTTLTLFE